MKKERQQQSKVRVHIHRFSITKSGQQHFFQVKLPRSARHVVRIIAGIQFK